MRILFLEWDSLYIADIQDIFQELGNEVISMPYDERGSKEEIEKISLKIDKGDFDFVFSINFFPNVSNCCKELGIKYVAWIYESANLNAYSSTILNECNYIFLFDYMMYEELKSVGIDTVYYLPMAVNERRLSQIKNTQDKKQQYSCEIAFVGSLYSEPRHRLYDKFAEIDLFTKGYLDGIIQAQKNIHGYYFLPEMLTPDVLTQMQKAYPINANAGTVLTQEAIYADYVLARQVTSLERQEILQMLGEQHEMVLYTKDKGLVIENVKNRGAVDDRNEVPYIFMNAKINLNITLRSIKTGIPLHAMDIMGNGGFLLTNYQEEMFEYFEENKDFVCYSDYEELKEKIAYYLEHDEEREKIARSGCEKVRKNHNLRIRVGSIIEIVTGA